MRKTRRAAKKNKNQLENQLEFPEIRTRVWLAGNDKKGKPKTRQETWKEAARRIFNEYETSSNWNRERFARDLSDANKRYQEQQKYFNDLISSIQQEYNAELAQLRAEIRGMKNVLVLQNPHKEQKNVTDINGMGYNAPCGTNT